jgi:hypothetical protein
METFPKDLAEAVQIDPLRTEKSFSMSEGANLKTTTYRGNLGKVHTPEK